MALVHFLLRRQVVDQVVKPVRDRAAIRRWMAAGRPSPPPHAVKVAAVWMLADLYALEVFVETGTHYRRMIRALAPRFRKIYSIELSSSLATAAAKDFDRYPHVEIIQGDSGQCLPRVLAQLHEPAIYWLDAHYCSGDSARAALDSPVEQEIHHILRLGHKGSVILIDDARLFSGKGGYPTLARLRDDLRDKTRNPVFVFDDMICARL